MQLILVNARFIHDLCLSHEDAGV